METKKIKVMSLDLSVTCTGFAKFVGEELVEYGSITPDANSFSDLDRYPQSAIRRVSNVAKYIAAEVEEFNPDVLVVEEIILMGIKGLKTIKALCMVHGMAFQLIPNHIDKIVYLGPAIWRSMIGLKKEDNWKQSAINFVKDKYELDFKMKDNDIADAICIAHAQIYGCDTSK